MTTSAHSGKESDWLVACLCAAWCGTCRDYRATLEAMAREHPALHFAWLDIEDEADALAPFDLDIENFPTLLVARGDDLRFLGTVLPHANTLARTLQAAREAVLPGMKVERPQALIGAVRAAAETLR